MNQISKKIFARKDNRKTSPISEEADNENIIGWFSNKFNPAFGWSVHPLTAFDIAWFESQNVSTKGVLRIASEKGLSIAKFNFDKHQVAFFDNTHYVATDEIKFERLSAFEKFIFDDERTATKIIASTLN